MKGLLILLGLVAAAGIAVAVTAKPSVAEMRSYLMALEGGRPDPWNRMTDQEIRDSYTLIVDYTMKNKKVTPGSDLQMRLVEISRKYNIFT